MLELNGMTRRPIGLTLIELLIVVALASILMLIAVPSISQLLRNSELSSTTNTLLAGINSARSEAMKRGGYAMVVPNGNGSGTSWAKGWVVFVDGNTQRDRAFNLTTDTGDVLVFAQPELNSYFTISGSNTAGANPAYIMFDPSGYSTTKNEGFGDVTLTLSRNDITGPTAAKCREVRSIVIERTGRVRSCTPTGSGDPTCPVAPGGPCS